MYHRQGVPGGHIWYTPPPPLPSLDFKLLPEGGGRQGGRRDGLEEGNVDLHRFQHLRQLARAVGYRVVLEELLHLQGYLHTVQRRRCRYRQQGEPVLKTTHAVVVECLPGTPTAAELSDIYRGSRRPGYVSQR